MNALIYGITYLIIYTIARVIAHYKGFEYVALMLLCALISYVIAKDFK